MVKKRKRPVKDDAIGPRSTAPRVVSTSSKHDGIAGHHSHPVISLYYPRVLTLRQYLLQQIPVSSKARRRRIAAVRVDETNQGLLHGGSTTPMHEVANLLDSTLVGVLKDWPATSSLETRREWARFTQSLTRSQLDSTDMGATCAQSEIVDFVISTLFNRSSLSSKPQHLLTHGFQRACGPSSRRNTAAPTCSIPGITALHPNHNAQALKQAPWTDVLALLGSNGDEIMMRLLLDCGTFTAVNKTEGVYYQICGLPLSVLEPTHQTVSQENGPDFKMSTVPLPSTRAVVPAPPVAGSLTTTAKNSIPCGGVTLQKPNSIVFFRRRMLYARPAINSKGEVQFGLASRHVLNRYGSSDSVPQTLHVLKYIFPRQFGLHNIFTSVLDRYETSLPFKDYFTREEEIARELKQRPSNKIPKRLRGGAAELARQLQNRHKHCSYRQLLKHYCPLDSSGPWKLGPVDSQPDSTSGGSSTSEPLVTQGPGPLRSSDRDHVASDVQDATVDLTTTKLKVKISLTDYATPLSSVSAFCRAVLRKLIPSQFYGTGEDKLANQEIIMRHVDRFVSMRRFESFSIHEVCEGIKIARMSWLVPHGMASQQLSSSPEKLSRTDLQKRTELFHEAIYYIFDSLLVPLIRSNFYVTESQTHRNRLFYFRHDVWQRLTQQPLAHLKSTVFEELNMETARRVLGTRTLGYGSLRLLPKSTGIRPILNLRRRVMLQKKWNGKSRSFLGASVNTMMTPIHNILNYEKRHNPAQMGSCVFSVGDIQARLKDFKHRLSSNSLGLLPSQQRLYFVKLDIQSCFDTIPQRKLVRFIENLVTEDAYHITRHVEMRPPNKLGRSWPFNPQGPGKPSKKYMGRAASASNPEHLPKAIAAGASASRRNTVFVDMPTLKQYSVEDLLDLLNEHVSNNLVQFGRRYFRQRNGIPQGSVLSSILCNLFYAEMEREVLGFLQSDDTLLLRLIDDFLLVTTDQEIATRFLHVMLAGQPDYGVSVNPAKSLVNFAATTAEGTHIPRLLDTSLFPYCGNLIDTRTLEIFRDHERQLEGGDSAAAAISNSLTVESGRTPGRSFHRKIVSAFILHLHPMYYDDTHNSPAAVWTNLYANFMTAAMKLYRYLRALSGRTHPSADVIVRTIRDVLQVAYRLVQKIRERGPSSTVMHPSQAQYLGATAFRFVLGRKQTRYAEVLRWVEGVVKRTRPESARKRMQLTQVVDQGNSMYGGWKF